MGKNFKKKSEEQELVRKFEKTLSGDSYHFFELDDYEKIIFFYLDNEKFKKAYKACEIAEKQYPFSVDIILLKTQALGPMGQIEEAEELLNMADSMQPNDSEIIMARANLANIQGKWMEAIHHFYTALDHAEGEEKQDILYNIAMTYQAHGRYDKAIGIYKDIVKEDISHQNALYELAFCLDTTDKLEEAISFYEKFIDEDPFSSNAWYNLGVVYAKMENYSRAIECYDYAVTIEDDFASAWFNLGHAYMQEERFTEALDAIKKTMDLEGPSAETFAKQGEIYEAMDQFDLSIKYYQKSIKLDNFYHEAYYGIGHVMSLQEKWLEATHFLQKAIKLDNSNERYWALAALAEYKLGNLQNSIEAFNQASILSPESIDIWLDWSFLYYESGNNEEAIEIISDGIFENPQAAELHYRMTAYLLEDGKFKEAFNFLENALILDFEKHTSLFEFFPKLETQKALFKIIDQYRNTNS